MHRDRQAVREEGWGGEVGHRRTEDAQGLAYNTVEE